MGINGIGPSSVLANLSPIPNQTVGSTSESFAKFLSDAIDNANNLSAQADSLTAEYAAGGPVSLDQMMIAEQQASIALDLVVQVRDRVVNAYQTIMNMQV